jgi:hypothetical protein
MTMNNQFVCHWVVTLLTVTWHLGSLSEEGGEAFTSLSGLEQTLDGGYIVHPHCRPLLVQGF